MNPFGINPLGASVIRVTVAALLKMPVIVTPSTTSVPEKLSIARRLRLA